MGARLNAGFGQLRVLADVLRLSCATFRPLRPLATELFRAQTELNHRVVDVLEDAVWSLEPAFIEQRLGALAARPPDVLDVRGGARGHVVVSLKRAGLRALEPIVGHAMQRLAGLNRQVIDALEERRPLPSLAAYRRSYVGKRWLGLEAWFEAQAEFFEAVARFIDERGEALTSHAAAYLRYSREHQPRPPVATTAKVQVLTDGNTIDPTADVVFVLPQGETLAAGAIDRVGEVFTTQPGVQLCYGDTFFESLGFPSLKPGWSPEYQASAGYIGGCFAMRTSLALRLGPRLSPAMVGELREAQVVRIAWVLSSRDAPQDIQAHPVVLRGSPVVSIIVPFKDRVELLRGLWRSLERYDPGLSFELILVSNQSEEAGTLEFLEQLRDPRVSWFRWDEPFNWSAINNAAAARATGELLLFLNNDVEATHPGWLRALAGYAMLPEVGVVGARLHYEDGSVQHAGVVIGLRGLAGHVFARWRPDFGLTPFGTPAPVRNWSAVTGACQLIRRALFHELGGFDESFRVSGGDIELCLRARARGLRVVCVGHAVLLHFESASRRSLPVPSDDVRREAAAYAALIATGDPYYHPALSLEAGHGGIDPG